MTVIKDIRIYRSCIENIDGNSLPYSFSSKELNCILHRIAMKLRENKFTMGDFNHLYINLTTCAVEDKIAPAKRSKDKYYKWYRYYVLSSLSPVDIQRMLSVQPSFCPMIL